MASLFGPLYFGFLFGYPLLQLWTLVRCRSWWRAFALFCLIPTAPFFVWSWMDFLGYFSKASLGSLAVMLFGPVPMLYLAVVALGFELSRKKRLAAAKRDAIIDNLEGPV